MPQHNDNGEFCRYKLTILSKGLIKLVVFSFNLEKNIKGNNYIMSKSKLYFAKFNINEKIHEVYKKEELLDYYLKEIISRLTTDLVICYDEIIKEVKSVHSIKDIKSKDNSGSVDGPEENCSYYKFMQLDFIQKSGDEIVNGRVVRVFPEDWHRLKIDEDGKESLDDYHTPDKTTYVTFSFNVTKEIVGFSSRNQFRKEKFLQIFKLLIEQSAPKVGQVELFLLIDSGEMEVKFKKIEKLTDLVVDFIPPNSSRSEVEDIVKGIEELQPYILESNATKATIDLHAPTSNPINQEAGIVKAMKKLATKAYAVIKAKGKGADNQEVIIDTSKDVVFTRDVRSSDRDDIEIVSGETEIATNFYRYEKKDEVIADE